MDPVSKVLRWNLKSSLKRAIEDGNKPYKLYAILPAYAPGPEVSLILARTDEDAMEHGIYIAAKDTVDIIYGSPYAEVFCIGDAQKIGDAKAIDFNPSWEWAKDVPQLVEEHDQNMKKYQ